MMGCASNVCVLCMGSVNYSFLYPSVLLSSVLLGLSLGCVVCFIYKAYTVLRTCLGLFLCAFVVAVVICLDYCFL